MQHSLLTLTVAISCLLGGVAVYLIFFRRALEELRLADRWLDAESIRIENEPIETYLQKIDPDYTETGMFISVIEQQAKSGMIKVDLESALADVENRLLGSMAWPRFYAQIAVYIGLLGTILGLWLALASLQGATDIHDEATLKSFASSIRELLGSLQGAFVSALAGVLVTSVLGWKIQYFDRSTQQYVDRLDKFARQQLLPNLESSRLGMLPQSGLEAAQLIVTQLDKSLGTFTRLWAERFKLLADETARMEESNTQLRTSIQSLSQSVGSMSHLASNLEVGLSEVASASKSSMEVTQRGVELMTSASFAVSKLSERAEQWPDLSSQLEQSSARVTNASEMLSNSVSRLSAATSGLSDSWSGLREHLDELTTDSYKKLNDSFLNSVEAIAQKANSELESVVKGVTQRDADLSLLAERIGVSVERQGTYAAKLAEVVHNMYGNMPALEDPRPTLEMMLASLRNVSEAIQAKSVESNPADSGVPVAAGHLADRAVFDKSLLSRIEMLVNTIQTSKVATDQSNSKLDRIAQLLDEQNRIRSRTQSDSNPESGSSRKGRWPFGR